MLIPSVNRYESHIRPFSFTCAHKFLPISCETNTFNSFGAGNLHIQHARMGKVEASSCADILSFAICITIWKQDWLFALLTTLLPTLQLWKPSRYVELQFKNHSPTRFSKKAEEQRNRYKSLLTLQAMIRDSLKESSNFTRFKSAAGNIWFKADLKIKTHACPDATHWHKSWCLY